MAEQSLVNHRFLLDCMSAVTQTLTSQGCAWLVALGVRELMRSGNVTVINDVCANTQSIISLKSRCEPASLRQNSVL